MRYCKYSEQVPLIIFSKKANVLEGKLTVIMSRSSIKFALCKSLAFFLKCNYHSSTHLLRLSPTFSEGYNKCEPCVNNSKMICTCINTQGLSRYSQLPFWERQNKLKSTRAAWGQTISTGVRLENYLLTYIYHWWIFEDISLSSGWFCTMCDFFH